MMSWVIRASRAGFLTEALREAPDLDWVIRCAVKSFGEQTHRADRRLQFVADIGDEIAAHAVEPKRLGPVFSQKQGVPGSEACHPHIEMDVGVAERATSNFDFGTHRLASAPHLICDRDEFRMHERAGSRSTRVRALPEMP